MINFAKQSTKTRREAFTVVAQMMKMNEGIVEKDFYVVLLLEVLFQHTKYGKHFAFKGGTSLSKAYGIIKRFSEDVDVVMDWELLGLTDEDVWKDRSNRQQQIFNRSINEQAGKWIEENLVEELKSTLENLGLTEFNVFVREEDKQTVIIEYPREYDVAGVLPEIRLEIGPLAAWTPIKEKEIESYVAEKIPNVFSNAITVIPTVEAKRTFWEKATILHKEAHRKRGSMPTRYSRHYYDLYMLANSDVKQEAFEDIKLLDRVANFKKKFYMDNSAKYDEAVPATLLLSPQFEQIDNLRKDYDRMQSMLFGEYPTFDDILNEIRELEKEIHHLG